MLILIWLMNKKKRSMYNNSTQYGCTEDISLGLRQSLIVVRAALFLGCPPVTHMPIQMENTLVRTHTHTLNSVSQLPKPVCEIREIQVCLSCILVIATF